MQERSALETAYEALARLALSVTEEEAWLPTGCTGWSVRDLLLHLLSDAQRGLVALATPAHATADRDAVSYWTDAPSGDDAEYRGLRGTRIVASAYGLSRLVEQYAETARAVVHLASRTPDDRVVGTQGHTLTVPDLVSTLVVEAALHHLDLVTHLTRPGPADEPLRTVRNTLDGLLGRPEPVGWDDATYARSATGRRGLTASERAALGSDADRLPLLA